MGFYSANTLEQKRVKQLTGDINIHDMFKNECNARGIPIYNAYNIHKADPGKLDLPETNGNHILRGHI